MGETRGRGAVVVLAALALAGTAQANGPVGQLSQSSASSACAHNTGAAGCMDAAGIATIVGVTVAPGGGAVLASSAINTGTVAVFALAGGALSQQTGEAGCIGSKANPADPPTDGCRVGINLLTANDLAVSADGKHVYVATGNGLAALTLDPSTGLTKLSAGKAACYSDSGSAMPENAANACTDVRGVSNANGVALSPDGQYVYLLSSRPGASAGVAIFTRVKDPNDPNFGALIQGDGATGCVSGDGTASGDADNKGCGAQLLRGVDRVNDIAVSANGAFVYVSTNKGVIVLARQANGALVQLDGTKGCIVSAQADAAGQTCTNGYALPAPRGLALAPDGHQLYVGNGASTETVTVLTVEADGSLSQAGTTACVSGTGTVPDGEAVVPVCAKAHSLMSQNGQIAVAPDGSSVLVSGTGASNEFAVLKRAADGSLSAPADRDACVSFDGSATGNGGGADKCVVGRGSGPVGFAFTPSGEYAVSVGTAIGVFARQVAPVCQAASAITEALKPITLSFPCSDANGDAVTVSVTGAPGHGTATATGATVSYTPAAGFTGGDSFTVTGSDGVNASAPVAGSVTVNPAAGGGGPGKRKAPLAKLVSTTKVERDRRGRLRFRLSCPAGAIAHCRGTLTVITRDKYRVPPKPRQQRQVIFRTSFDIAPGKKRTFTPQPSAAGKNLLSRRPWVSVNYRITGRASSTLTATKKTRKGFVYPYRKDI